MTTITVGDFLPYADKWHAPLSAATRKTLTAMPANAPLSLVWEIAMTDTLLVWLAEKAEYVSEKSNADFQRLIQRSDLETVRTLTNDKGQTLWDVMPDEGRRLTERLQAWFNKETSSATLDECLLEANEKYLKLKAELHALCYVIAIARRGAPIEFVWTGSQLQQDEAERFRQLVSWEKVEPLLAAAMGLTRDAQ